MLIGLLSFIVFLFAVYVLAKEDFVLLRKNVLTEHVFDIIFLGFLLALLAGRIVFVLFHFSVHYLNPFVFFLLPYFPGISVEGGILGAGLYVYFYARNKKIPSLRISDILTQAYLIGCATFFLISGVWDLHLTLVVGLLSIAVAVFYITCFFLIKNIFTTSHWQDGVVTGASLVIDSLLRMLYIFALMMINKKITFRAEMILTILLFLTGGVFFFIRRSRYFTSRRTV